MTKQTRNFIPGRIDIDKCDPNIRDEAVLYNQLGKSLLNANKENRRRVLSQKFGKLGYNALHLATLFSDKDLIKLYGEMKLPFDVIDGNGRNPLHLLFGECEDFNLSIMLLNYGVNPNLADELGDTPFHIACARCDNQNIIDFMLSKGVDINFPNSDSKTGFEIMIDALVEVSDQTGKSISVQDLKILELFTNNPEFIVKECYKDAIAQLKSYCEEGCDGFLKTVEDKLNLPSNTSGAVKAVRVHFAETSKSRQE